MIIFFCEKTNFVSKKYLPENAFCKKYISDMKYTTFVKSVETLKIIRISAVCKKQYSRSFLGV